MQEKILIQSYCPSTKKLLKTMAIIGLIISLFMFMSQCSSRMSYYNECKETYQEHQEKGNCGSWYESYEQCWRCEYAEENHPAKEAFVPAFLVFAGFIVLALIIKLLLTSFSLTVTDKRIYCKVLWIHHVCLPVDFITAVGRVGFFNILTVGAPSGHIAVMFVKNAKAIYEVINDLLIARQQKELAPVEVTEPVETVEEPEIAE